MENRLVFTYILQFPLFFFIDKQNITDNSFESFSTEYLVNEETLEDSFQNRDYDKVWLDRMGKKILLIFHVRASFIECFYMPYSVI